MSITCFKKLKLHPKIREILKGGKVVKYGAKAVTVGGWGCMPKKLYAPGAMVIGDSASFLNAARIKGIHLAMKSGMLAGEAAFECLLAGEFGEAHTKKYKEKSMPHGSVRKWKSPRISIPTSPRMDCLQGLSNTVFQK